MTEREFKSDWLELLAQRKTQQVLNTILAVFVPFLAGFALTFWVGLNTTVTSVLVYGTMIVWLVLIWRPRKPS